MHNPESNMEMGYINFSGILRYKQLGQMTWPRHCPKKKKKKRKTTCLKVESENKDKYQDLARELKFKLWNIKVTVMPIVIGARDTITKRMVEGLENLEEEEDQWISSKLRHCSDHPEYWEESWRLE